ncbi:MAG: hypothetical protein AMJ78_08250 [Omnitrophica WOR_2 bacterium SM23_29]|nr:MAG: hypothetical protein AMJ78_08250 [Omnitrophica WOR_2 bacterium SM23_29]
MLHKGLFKMKKPKPIPRQIVIKIAIGIITCLVLTSIIYVGKVPYGRQPQVGDISNRTIYAPFDFSYSAGTDIEKTEELKKAVSLGVKDIYDMDINIYDNVAQNIKSLFVTAKNLKNMQEVGLDDKVERLKTADKFSLTDGTLRSLLQSEELNKAEPNILNRTNEFFGQGIISQEEKENLVERGKNVITIRNLVAQVELSIDVKNLKTLDEFKQQLADAFDESFSSDKKFRSAISEVATKSLVPNLRYNEIETSSRREKVVAAVPIQKKMEDVKRDELIIQRGERLTPIHVAKLEVLRSTSLEGQRFFLSILGIGLVVFALVIITSFYFAYYEPKIYSNDRHLLLISFILIALTATGKAISLSKAPNYLIPIASGPMIIALLLGARPAIVIAITLSFLTGLLVGGKFDLALIFLVGSIVGIYAIKGTRRRSRLLTAGVLTGIANSLCVIGLGILNNLESEIILSNSSFVLLNGIIVGIFLTGTLHLFESLFQITTNITLLELADPNNPLLKELILKAPGTYHHSLIVGNLAEAACETIGANGLLARVGAYYHDIGKVEKAEYFVENQPIMESQHDKLAPSMSSLIIISHVKEGLEKAKKAGLNRALIDFIEQHHGTGLIHYFYQRALESVEDLDKLEEQGFRYPGPKPQTKETAIVHLADSVEAASRTLKKPTPTNLEELVRRIINNKFIDGQLDECELTLKDLNVIAATFAKVLTGVYHARIEYPPEKEKTEA